MSFDVHAVFHIDPRLRFSRSIRFLTHWAATPRWDALRYVFKGIRIHWMRLINEQLGDPIPSPKHLNRLAPVHTLRPPRRTLRIQSLQTNHNLIRRSIWRLWRKLEPQFGALDAFCVWKDFYVLSRWIVSKRFRQWSCFRNDNIFFLM